MANELIINDGFISQGTSYVSDGNLGVGVTSPTSRLEVKGVDSSPSNYSLKVDNSGSTSLLIVRNDGNVAIGTATPTAGTRLHVYRAVNDFLYEVKVENPTNEVSAASAILIQSNSGKLEFGQLSTLHTTYSGYGQLSDTFIRSGTGARNLNIITDPSNTGKILFWSRLNPTTDAAFPSLAIDGQKVGFGLNTPTATTHIKGVDATSANYALKVENSGSTSLLSVRNDGIINFGNAVETNQRLVRFGQDTSFVDIGSRAVTSTFAAIYFNTATPSVNNYALIGNGTDLFLGGGTLGTIGFKFNSPTNTFALTKHTCTFTPFGLGNADGLVFNMSGSSRSYLTAGADHTWGNIDMSTATHPEGSTALQRDFVVRGRQHAFAGAATTYTIAEAGTFVIDGAPQASVRCDITNNSALLIQSQNVVNGVFGTVTNSYGLTVNSQTGATNNYAAIFLGGNVGIGTSTPTSQLDINGTNGYNQLRLRTSYTPSGSTDINGSIGDVCWDDNYFYWKTSTQWLRISGQTW